jgi:hypothetical protein
MSAGVAGIEIVVIVIIVVEDLSTVSHRMRATTSRPGRSMVARRPPSAATHAHFLFSKSHLALSKLHLTISEGILVSGD